MLSDVLVRIFRLLPARFREQLKARVGAAGHTASVIDAWRARRLAQTWKRPDVIVGYILEIIDGIGRRSLNGCRVMDFGSGILPADAFGYAMFGAAEVHAVDYTPLYQDRAFHDYVSQFDCKQFLPLLADRCGPSAAEDWLRRVSLARADNGARWFHHIGLRYVAPFDLLKDAPPAQSYDLIASRSTMEHIREDLAATMVARMAQLVAPGGAMHHHIHLADHRDINANAHAFLSADDDYSPAQHDIRGNRLRASDWREIFSKIDGFTCNETLAFTGSGPLPKVLATRFRNYDSEDLRVTVYDVNCIRRAPLPSNA